MKKFGCSFVLGFVGMLACMVVYVLAHVKW